MPDRLGDALENSEPARHQLLCPKCGDVIKGSTSLGVRMAMKIHRNHTCPKRAGKSEDDMSTPFDDLVGALGNLSQMVSSPLEHIKALAESEDLASVLQARSDLIEMLGSVPLPGNHPHYDAIVGAIGNAQGTVDNITQAYQLVRTEAQNAQAAIQQINETISMVVSWLSGGN